MKERCKLMYAVADSDKPSIAWLFVTKKRKWIITKSKKKRFEFVANLFKQEGVSIAKGWLEWKQPYDNCAVTHVSSTLTQTNSTCHRKLCACAALASFRNSIKYTYNLLQQMQLTCSERLQYNIFELKTRLCGLQVRGNSAIQMLCNF